ANAGAGGRRRRRKAEPGPMRLGRAAFEQHDFDDPQCDNAKDAREQNAGKKQPGAAGLQRLSRRPLGDDGGARRRLEMPRPARVVVISLEGLGCDHHRLVMIWAIKSSSEFARRVGVGWAAAIAVGSAAGGSGGGGRSGMSLAVA